MWRGRDPDGHRRADRHGDARARRVRDQRPARAVAPAGDRGDVWRVNGRKMFITNGTRAHFLTLVAKTDTAAGHHGVSLFLVDTSLPGVSVSRRLEKLGMHASDTAEIGNGRPSRNRSS